MSDRNRYVVRGLRSACRCGFSLAITLGFGFLGSAAMAQSVATSPKPLIAKATGKVESAVTVELKQSKVVKDSKGVETLVDAASVLPGDLIEYRATYKNASTKAVSSLIADLPIPEGMQYQPNSARPGPALAQASGKDGQYAAEPLQRKLAGGKPEPLPYNEYRALRWNLGTLPAGGVAAVSARARIEEVVPPAASASAAR